MGRIKDHHWKKRRGAGRGLALPEVLICAAIGSLLLTAVAVAFRASFNSYKDSEERGHLVNVARSCLTQFAGDVRSGDSVYSCQTVSGLNAIKIVKTHADSADPSAGAGYAIYYWFDPATQGIYAARGTLSSPSYLVCPYVQSWTASPAYPANSTSLVTTAAISFVLANKDANGARIIQDGSQQLSLTFSCSAVCRRSVPGI